MDWPPPEPEEEVTQHRVARANDVRAGRPRVVRVGVKQIVLFRIGERIYASDNSCPHAGGSLAAGHVEGTIVVCPRHGWAFDLATGGCPDHDVYRLRTYDVEVRDDDVYVALPVSRW